MFFHFLQHLGSQQIEADTAQVALVQGDDAVLFQMTRIEFDDAGLPVTEFANLGSRRWRYGDRPLKFCLLAALLPGFFDRLLDFFHVRRPQPKRR
jgi:hypothetical protein